MVYDSQILLAISQCKSNISKEHHGLLSHNCNISFENCHIIVAFTLNECVCDVDNRYRDKDVWGIWDRAMITAILMNFDVFLRWHTRCIKALALILRKKSAWHNHKRVISSHNKVTTYYFSHIVELMSRPFTVYVSRVIYATTFRPLCGHN